MSVLGYSLSARVCLSAYSTAVESTPAGSAASSHPTQPMLQPSLDAKPRRMRQASLPSRHLQCEHAIDHDKRDSPFSNDGDKTIAIRLLQLTNHRRPFARMSPNIYPPWLDCIRSSPKTPTKCPRKHWKPFAAAAEAPRKKFSSTSYQR